MISSEGKKVICMNIVPVFHKNPLALIHVPSIRTARKQLVRLKKRNGCELKPDSD